MLSTFPIAVVATIAISDLHTNFLTTNRKYSLRNGAKLFGKIVESAEVKEDNRHEEVGSALERVRRRNNGHIEEETRCEEEVVRLSSLRDI